MLQLAQKTDGVIVTNDNLRDLSDESTVWRDIIKKRYKKSHINQQDKFVIFLLTEIYFVVYFTAQPTVLLLPPYPHNMICEKAK